jgi:uncharacterized glyoxalase superfamily protein PhnB
MESDHVGHVMKRPILDLTQNQAPMLDFIAPSIRASRCLPSFWEFVPGLDLTEKKARDDVRILEHEAYQPRQLNAEGRKGILAKEKTTMAVQPIPEGYHSVTPYLVVQGVPTLLDFLKHAFDATEIMRMPRADGAIMHAEVRIGDSIVMMGEATGEFQPMPASIHLYVHDADATYQRALQAGATSTMEPADQFWGDRHAGVMDPVGNRWWIATHQEDVPPEELERRADAFMQQQRSG